MFGQRTGPKTSLAWMSPRLQPGFVDGVEGELVEDPVSLVRSSGFVESFLGLHELVRLRQPLGVRDVDL